MNLDPKTLDDLARQVGLKPAPAQRAVHRRGGAGDHGGRRQGRPRLGHPRRRRARVRPRPGLLVVPRQPVDRVRQKCRKARLQREVRVFQREIDERQAPSVARGEDQRFAAWRPDVLVYRSEPLQASVARALAMPRSGRPVLLPDQDRARWDQLLIRRGLAAADEVVQRLRYCDSQRLLI